MLKSIFTLITLKQLLGYLLIYTSFWDAYKYSIQAFKISKAKTAKNFSRAFINYALQNDLIKLCYGLVILDIFIILSSIFALICMIHLWITIYLYYPYKHKGLKNFKRPTVLVYFINSLIPNSLRQKL